MTTQTFHDPGVLERPRYFPRQLMTPDELTLEQQYFRDKLRRHNRLLHGWGVVCGAIVCRLVRPDSNGKNGHGAAAPQPCPPVEDESCLDPWIVTVSPGYILGPCGDEILIDCPVKVDVRKSCVTVTSGELCPPAPDPWCNDVTVQRRPGPVYLAVRYKEVLTRPVRVHPAGCGCDDTACEYSRIRDGFEVCALDECPATHREPPDRRIECELHPCPPCPDDPWVVLARIEVGPDGIIGQPDNYSCRRQVITFAEYWCRPQPPDSSRPEERPVAEIDTVEERREKARAVLAAHTDLSEEQLADMERLSAVRAQKATRLRDITPDSNLGKKLDAAGLTIAGLAAMERERFIEMALEGEEERVHGLTEIRANKIYDHALRVMETLIQLEKRS